MKKRQENRLLDKSAESIADLKLLLKKLENAFEEYKLAAQKENGLEEEIEYSHRSECREAAKKLNTPFYTILAHGKLDNLKENLEFRFYIPIERCLYREEAKNLPERRKFGFFWYDQANSQILTNSKRAARDEKKAKYIDVEVVFDENSNKKTKDDFYVFQNSIENRQAIEEGLTTFEMLLEDGDDFQNIRDAQTWIEETQTMVLAATSFYEKATQDFAIINGSEECELQEMDETYKAYTEMKSSI